MYSEGEMVHVFAEIDPYSAVVRGWSSSVAGPKLPDEWHLLFTMPGEDVPLTPELTTVSLGFTDTQWDGVANPKRVVYAVPTNPKGVVFMFHGTGGSARVINNPSMHYVARLAYHRGYAIFATDAEERTLATPDNVTESRWDANPSLATNIDLQNIERFSARLSADTDVPANAPRFAVGMSNGGSFVVSVGATLPIVAGATFCATGRETAWTVTTTPNIWLMCQNDTNESVAPKRDEWPDPSASLANRSVNTDYDVLQRSPMFPGRFARIAGVDLETSRVAAAPPVAVAARSPLAVASPVVVC